MSERAVRIIASDGEEFMVPEWCFAVGSTATSALHTVCAKAAPYAQAPAVRLSQPLPQLRVAIAFMVDGALPPGHALPVESWLALHRTSALLHYPALRDAVESVLASLHEQDGRTFDVAFNAGATAASHFPLDGGGALPPQRQLLLLDAAAHGAGSGAAGGSGLTTPQYLGHDWQSLYGGRRRSELDAAVVASAAASPTRTGIPAGGGALFKRAADTALPDPFGFTRRAAS
jgi:hypothetical protein